MHDRIKWLLFVHPGGSSMGGGASFGGEESGNNLQLAAEVCTS